MRSGRGEKSKVQITQYSTHNRKTKVLRQEFRRVANSWRIQSPCFFLPALQYVILFLLLLRYQRSCLWTPVKGKQWSFNEFSSVILDLDSLRFSVVLRFVSAVVRYQHTASLSIFWACLGKVFHVRDTKIWRLIWEPKSRADAECALVRLECIWVRHHWAV